MGLDIVAFENIQRVEKETNDSFAPYVNPDFPGRADEIEKDSQYISKNRFHFHAGSYSGYNEWRDMLAKLAGYDSARSVWQTNSQGPFSELINFSDCEGVIGASVSKKLAQDFEKYQSAADEHRFDWFTEQYNRWRKAMRRFSGSATGMFGT